MSQHELAKHADLHGMVSRAKHNMAYMYCGFHHAFSEGVVGEEGGGHP